MKIVSRHLVVVVAVVAALLLTAAPSQAARGGFGYSAKTVARAGGCAKLGRVEGPTKYYRSAVTCTLHGRRIGVVTFRDKLQEVRLLALVCTSTPSRWVDVTKGALFSSDKGDRRAAATARRVYGGTLTSCRRIVKHR